MSVMLDRLTGYFQKPFVFDRHLRFFSNATSLKILIVRWDQKLFQTCDWQSHSLHCHHHHFWVACLQPTPIGFLLHKTWQFITSHGSSSFGAFVSINNSTLALILGSLTVLRYAHCSKSFCLRMFAVTGIFLWVSEFLWSSLSLLQSLLKCFHLQSGSAAMQACFPIKQIRSKILALWLRSSRSS